MKRYGDARTVADLLKISVYTAQDMFRRRCFPKHVAFRLGRSLRWDLDELERWCASGAGDAEPPARVSR